VDLAQAVLSLAGKGSGQAASRAAEELLETGPSEAYVGWQSVGEGHGDGVFQHPYVECLLRVARRQVSQALAEQPEDDRWLICVRTYGRAGEPLPKAELRRFLAKHWKRGGFADLQRALFSLGIDSMDTLRDGLQDIDALRKRIRVDGDGAYVPSYKSLDELRDEAESENGTPAPGGCKKKDRRAGDVGILELTLSTLERALGSEAHRRCLIFVSHEDKAFTSGLYAAALKGTPWERRVVQGVKGAHLQVRFIEEAAPHGMHLVVADDNIAELFVECVSEAFIQQQKKEGIQDHMVRPMSAGFAERPLGDARLGLAEESEVLRFLHAAMSSSQAGRGKLKSFDEAKLVKDALARLDIDSLPKLSKLLEGDFSCSCKNQDRARLQEALNAVGCKATPYLVVKKLRAQVGVPLPPRKLLVVRRRCRQKSGLGAQAEGGPELAALIRRAGLEMENQGANIWAMYPSKNHYWLHGFGTQIRQRARTTGIYKDHSEKLGLVYGAFFGFRVLHDQRRYTRYGQVKDDVERTLRYWHCDGKVVRFNRYGVVKDRCHLVGKFHAKKGGISAESSAELHKAEATRALTGMLEEFASKHARLAKPGEVSSCGLIWHADKEVGDEAEAEAEAECASRKRKHDAAAKNGSESSTQMLKTKHVVGGA